MASPLVAEDHLDRFIARHAVRFMRRYRDQPFFLVASFMKPHSPFYPPAEWARRYPVDRMALPEVGDISGYPPHIQRRIKNTLSRGEKRQRAHRAGYLGNLAFVDTCIGQVYGELEALGLLEKTIVVYTSDHGEMDGDHGFYQKSCLFEPSVRVPLIISHPGRIPQGETAGALTEQIGLYPTLAELAGLAAPAETTLHPFPGAAERIDATSFAAIARHPNLAGPDAAFSEYNLRSQIPQYMVRTRRYKYIHNLGTMHELYDHESDPGERVNRIDDPGLAAVRRELRDRLHAWCDPEANVKRFGRS